jgi:hypothetical protein
VSLLFGLLFVIKINTNKSFKIVTKFENGAETNPEPYHDDDVAYSTSGVTVPQKKDKENQLNVTTNHYKRRRPNRKENEKRKRMKKDRKKKKRREREARKSRLI